MKIIEFCSPEEKLGKQEYDLDPPVVIPPLGGAHTWIHLNMLTKYLHFWGGSFRWWTETLPNRLEGQENIFLTLASVSRRLAKLQPQFPDSKSRGSILHTVPAQQMCLGLASEIRKEKDTLTVGMKCFQRRISKRDIKHKSIAWIYVLFNKGYHTFILSFDREDRYSSWLPSYATQSSSHEKLYSEMSLKGIESPMCLTG